MKRMSFQAALLLAFLAALSGRAQGNQSGAADILSHPLARADAVQIALRQNSAILKGNADLRASYGIEVQLRAIALPQVTAGGGYNYLEPSLVESFPLPPPINNFVQIPNQNWNADVKVQQLTVALAKLRQEQSAIIARGAITHVMQERDGVPEAFVLFRGDYDKRRDKVGPVTPGSLPPMPPDLPRNSASKKAAANSRTSCRPARFFSCSAWCGGPRRTRDRRLRPDSGALRGRHRPGPAPASGQSAVQQGRHLGFGG